MRVKLYRISNGYYGWMNNVHVKKECRDKWCVYYCSGALAYTGKTLNECKMFLYHKYPDRFCF